MTKNYEKLTTPLKLKHGTLPTPIAMSPMVAKSSYADGSVSPDDLEFYGLRSQVAGMIITGAAFIAESGKGFDRQLGIEDDDKIAGLTKLATTLKKDGNKAILQLYHGGREAAEAYKLLGEVVAPSAVEFPFLPYTPRELTTQEIDQIIKDFANGAERAVAAGFDGVEIHGANHYLLQQFFSGYSNKRSDQWGGSLDDRMNFPLAVTKAVKEAVKDQKDFIVGYRFSPEEVHGDNVGYTIEDSLKLIDKIVDCDLDYIHTSLFTKYDDKPAGSDKTFAELVKETVGTRAKTIIVAGIQTADDALAALEHADIAAIGREALMEPEFAAKILADEAEEIVTKVTPETAENLGFTPELKAWFLMEGSALPPLPGQENL